MSEKVPEGWDKKRLSDFSTARRGTTYVSSELSEDKERFPLYINMKSFKVGGGYSENGDKYFTSPYSPNQLVQDNDLLIANTDVTDSCDILGAPAYVPREKLKNDVLFSHHVSALNISDDVSLDFLNFLMCSEHIRLEMKRYGRGTTVKMLDMRDIGKISLSIPPLPEQKKIASILTSVDEVIEKTQSQIDKLQDLKKGTMNELLTKGIGHTEFKDSELGRIPKSWEEKKLGEVGQFSKGKGISKKDIISRGVPCIRYAEIYTEYDFVIKNFKSFIHPDERTNSRRLQKNDIIFAGSGETVEDIGKSVAFVFDIEAYVGGDAILLSPTNEVDSVFLSYQLNDEIRRKQLRKLGQGSSVIHIYSSGLEEMQVSLPPLPEQKKIASIISSISSQIEIQARKLRQTKSLKKSLMQDLLTGKVRVSVN